MNVTTAIVSLLVGAFLGGFYFGGLWLTIRQLPTTAMAAVWVLASFMGRTAIVLAGFVYVANGKWESFVGCLVGFLLIRVAIVRLIPVQTTSSNSHIHSSLAD